MRVEAGVTITGEVEIALHHQIALGRLADNLHTRAQMESVGIGGVVQACQFVLQQVVVLQGSVDEQHTQGMFGVEVLLVDHLVRAPAGRGIGLGQRIVVADHAVERNRARTLDIQAATGIDGNVIAAQARRIEFQGATAATIIARRLGSVAQVNAYAIGEGQLALARTEHHRGAVRRIDDLAMAVHPQLAAMGVEHGAAVQGQAFFGQQVDAAHPLATGIHPPGNAQAAIVQRDTDAVGLDVIADAQVALLELEAARAKYLALVEPLVESSKLLVQGTASAQALGLDLNRTGQVRHQGAAGIVVTAAARQELARQVNHAAGFTHRHRPQLARLVVLGRQVNGRACGLQHIALAALQRDLATRAVFSQIVEDDGTPGHINQCVIAQNHVATRIEGDLAAGQHHRTGQADAVALQRQLAALAFDLATHTLCCRDIQYATGGDAVDRSRLTGQQRRQDVQVAARVGKPFDRVVSTLALIDRQAALVIGGDALAGLEVDVGKSQREAVEALGGARLGKIAITKFDALGADIQAPATTAGPARDCRAGRCLRAEPDQVGGVNARHITGTAGPIDRRGGEHQVAQQRFAGHCVIRIEGAGAIEVEAVAGRELQGFQGRRAELRVATQQAIQHILGQGHAGRQAIAGRRLGQRLRAADVDAGQPKVEMTGAVAHLIPHLQRLVGQGDDTAV
ncbi:hypothetical protein [Pseudomonas sp. 25 R 14]|nr:hypothetical protein [Pseudomonas sp. 25 R 14]